MDEAAQISTPDLLHAIIPDGAVTQPAGADQAAVTLGNADGDTCGLTIADPPTQAELQARRDKCEELADVM
jgi:hypothetical protein